MRYRKIARFVFSGCGGADIHVHRLCELSRKRKLRELYHYTAVLNAGHPPQQRDWIFRTLERCMDPRFSTEVIERIVDGVGGLMSESEADRYAAQMQQERDEFTKLNDARYFSLLFDIGATE